VNDIITTSYPAIYFCNWKSTESHFVVWTKFIKRN